MPTKPPITSLGGHICSVFIAASVQCYTDVLYRDGTPAFHILKDIAPPEGYNISKPKFWYRPWTKASLPAAPLTPGREPAGQVLSVEQQGITDSLSPALADIDDGPVIRMAGAKQPTAPSQFQHLPKESLLGYNWQISDDTLLTNKGDELNLFPARRGLRLEWAILRVPEDLLELHQKQPLRHRHVLAAAHGTYDPLLACP